MPFVPTLKPVKSSSSYTFIPELNAPRSKIVRDSTRDVNTNVTLFLGIHDENDDIK